MRARLGSHRCRDDVAAALALATFSMSVALGYARVFSGWPFVVDMAVVVLVGHGVGLLMRRLGVSTWLATLTMALALAWVVLALLYTDTLSVGLPTIDTWSALSEQVDSARRGFGATVAPVDYAAGWDALAAFGLALTVLLAELFAFRFDARAEALVPGGVLFVFVGAIGDDQLRLGSTVLLVGVGVASMITLRAYHSEPGHDRPVESAWRRWPSAIGFAVLVAAIAGLAGPRLPGADTAALYQPDRGGGGETLSPLVDIRSRLASRSTSELFRMSATTASYWRLSALPEFDGTTWGLPDGPLGASAESVGMLVGDNRQRLTVGSLGGSLIPAAAEPYQASGSGDLRWIPETSTLLVDAGQLEPGDVIDIVSRTQLLIPAVLASATSDSPGDEIYTRVPDDLPAEVASSARREVAGASSTYEAALKLQEWFQREFDYSLDVQPGHDNSAIERFLRDRIGYCEQFAGTYAAMMRTLNIPARVAVGFTSGIELSERSYAVFGRNAHAWPEVWFDNIGWVAFEPTPGRGAPNAEIYTGRPPRQDGSLEAGDLENTAVAPTTTVPIDPIADQNLPSLADDIADATTAIASSDRNKGRGAGQPPWRAIALLVMLAGAMGATAAFLVARLRHQRRRAQPVDQQLAAAWRRATAAVAVVGVAWQPGATPLEIAAAAAQRLPMAARPMTSLAHAVTEATYGAEGSDGFAAVGAYGASRLGDCRNWAKQIDRAATESLGWYARTRRYLTAWR